MSAQIFRTALSRLQDDPDHDSAWTELQEAVTSPDPGLTATELAGLLEAARGEHAARGEWDAAVHLLELEIAHAAGGPREAALQAELARALEIELFEEARATEAYTRLLALEPDSARAHEALARNDARRTKWSELVERYVAEASNAQDHGLRSALLFRAAEAAWRFGRREPAAVADAAARLEEAIALDPANRDALLLLERIYRIESRWNDAARVVEQFANGATSDADRAAGYARLARVFAKRLGSNERAAAAYERVLRARPGNREAMSFLSEFFSSRERWDDLAGLYEEQLRAGGVPAGEEAAVILQIAMVHWRARSVPEAAEPWFERLRRLEPAHPRMLAFFREWCEAHSDRGRLLAVLADAQRAMPEGPERAAIGDELARSAETESNASRAIDQYKAVLRHDPDNAAARAALRRLYAQTEAWSALVELLRQALERTAQEDVPGRLAVLREMADVYRRHVKSETSLATVLTQIAQLDPTDIDAVRDLVRVYESLSRWRDLLVYQQRLAELTEDPAQKLELYRATARRWLEQFSNAQNAVDAYEAVLQVAPRDEEARARLRELYTKRRAWGSLFALSEREVAWSEGPQKVELLVEMARLAAERLDRGSDAIALYKRVLEEEPNAPGALDALEKQAERERDFATVAEVLERRVAAATDDASRVGALQKLGDVFSQRLSDPAAAALTWRRVLAIQPTHAKALRMLRDAYLAAGDVGSLEELYGAQGDWEALAEVLSAAADRAPDGASKVDLSLRAARVYEARLGQPERAFRAYERVLSVKPDDMRAASALVPIYEKEERWTRLPALYEVLIAGASDPVEKVTFARRLAEVATQRLQDRDVALEYARRAYALDPEAEGALELLERASRAAGTWDVYVNALGARLSDSSAPLATTGRRALRARLADVQAAERGDVEAAVTLYRELVEEDPTEEQTIATLDRLLRSSGRREELRWLYDKRVDAADRKARVGLLDEWAALEDDAFGEPVRAIHLYRRALELEHGDARALAALPALLLATNDAAGAADVIERRRDLCEGAERAEREIELASIYVDRLGRPDDGLAAAERALSLSPQEPRALALIEQLVDVPTTRGAAAAALRREFSRAGDARGQVRALRVMLEIARAPAERLALYADLTDLNERELGAAGTALDVTLQAVGEFPTELEFWDRAASLAIASGRPAELANAFREAMRASLPAEVEAELGERAASLQDDTLGDAESAIPYLERVLERQPGNERAFARLRQILTSTERWPQLEGLYERVADATDDIGRRTALYTEIALVCDEITGERAKAIRYYERVLELDPGNDRISRALEGLYQAENKPRELARLLDARLENAPPRELRDIKRRLGRIYLEELHEPALALAQLDDVMREDPLDRDASALVERLLDVGALRTRAAEILEGVYEARDEARDLVRVLAIRLEAADDDGLRRDLLGRIAQLRDQRLQDDQGSFDALALLVPLDAADADARERLREIGARLGAHARVAETLLAAAERTDTREERAEILMEVARAYEDGLDTTDRAEAVYQRVVGLDRADASLVLPAARALERIYASRGDHRALAETLALEVGLEADGPARAELWARLGELHETTLDDAQGAIRAWRARLEEEPADARALGALERLYERVGEWRELVAVLRAREQAVVEPSARRRLLVKAAETLSERLRDTSEAIVAWRVVLDEYGADKATLAALERLYEASGQWHELGETLENDLALENDDAARIALLARLGDTRRQHLGDLRGALDAYRQALAIDAAHGPSREALERLLDRAEARREAAEILRPLYEADHDSVRLVRALDIEAETADLPSERLAALDVAVRVAEGPLGEPGRAFDYATRALPDAANDASLSSWLERLEALAATTSRHADLVAALSGIAARVSDDDERLRVIVRVADLAHERLGDAALAREWYRKALEVRDADPRALAALDRLYDEAGDRRALHDIVKRRADIAESESERRSLLTRQAQLERDALGDAAAAIATYETILDIGFDEGAADALEALYGETGREGDLMGLYERRIDARPGEEAALRVKRARVAAHDASDMSRAFEELAAALAIDPLHEGAIGELERLLAEPPSTEARARAAEMLEPAYARRADWGRVVSTLRARLEAGGDPEERRALLKRLAHLHEAQSEDYRAALEANALLLHDDPTDDEAWAEAERLARVAGSDARLAEIYAVELGRIEVDDAHSARLARRAGELFAQLGEPERALGFYRRSHAYEPDSRELFDAIDGLLTRADRPAERIELHRSALDYRTEPADRLTTLRVIADLEENALGSTDAAIETYRAALDVDERDAASLDALTRLYRQRGRFRDLADLFARRAESEMEAEQAATFRLDLARLYRAELNDPSAAIDELETIVGGLPAHPGAIAELEMLSADDAFKPRALDILRPLYERADDWRGLLRLNEQRVAIADDDSERVAILREDAHIYESRASDYERAFEAMRRAFELDPDDGEARVELGRLAAHVNAWDALAEAYQHGVAATDATTRRELLVELARVHDTKRNDPRRALEAVERLAAVDESDIEPLDAADPLAVLLGDWEALTRILAKKADLVVADESRAAILRRLGATRRDMLGDTAGAIEAYDRALELGPTDTAALDALLALLEERGDSARLVELYRRRVELTGGAEPDLAYEMLLRTASVQEALLGSRREAIDALHEALTLKPRDSRALRALDRLLRAEAMWPELLDNLRIEIEEAPSANERALLRRQVGDVYANELAEPAEALEAYRQVLVDAPSDRGTLEAIRAVGEAHEDLRVAAADVLEPALRGARMFPELIAALEMRLLAQSEPVDRAATLRAIAITSEHDLGNPSAALDAALRAVRETPGDEAAHVLTERLADASGGHRRYADTLADAARAAYDALLAKGLFARLGRIADEKLDDPEGAIGAYSLALEQAGDTPDLLAALDRLYARTGDERALADVLERRVAVEDDPSDRAGLLYRLARLQIDTFDDARKGLSTLRQALEARVDHGPARDALEELTARPTLFDEAADALESVYRTQGDHEALGRLFEKRIGNASTSRDRVRLRLELARVFEDQARDLARAQAAVESAVADDAGDLDVLAELERLAATNGRFDSAATALERALLAGGLSPDATRDQYVRLAGWYTDHLREPVAAERALERALDTDPTSVETLRALEGLRRTPGRERDLVETLRRRARAETDLESKRERLREAKNIAETTLSDPMLAEAVLRQTLDDDEADVWAIDELTRLRETARDWGEATRLLLRSAELTNDHARAAELKHRAARAVREQLGDAPRAMELYEELFEANPDDRESADALRALYNGAGRHRDLARLLESLVDRATSPPERTALRLDLAHLQAETLENPASAVVTLRAVLEEEAGQGAAVAALSTLYERTGHDDELAELLAEQSALAIERGEPGAYATLATRLGELYEGRLADTQKAVEAYEGVVARDAGNTNALRALARLHEGREEPARAAEALEKLLAQDQGPELVTDALRLADAYAKVNDDAGARRALERALAVDPTRAEARDRLRVLYEKGAEWALLADLLVADADLAESDAAKVRLLRQAADVHSAKRADAAAAAVLLERASIMAPADRELLFSLCDAYGASGRSRDAVAALENIARSYGGKRLPELATIHHRLAQAYLADGDKTRALAELDAAFKNAPGSIAVLKDLGALTMEMGDLERAQKMYRALLLQRLDTSAVITKAEVFYNLGVILNMQGDKRKAIDMLQRAIENDPKHEKARLLLVEIKGSVPPAPASIPPFSRPPS